MGYDETTNLKLKKPTLGTSKTEWPGYVNGNFDTIDTEVADRHGKAEDVIPDRDNTRSIGSAIRRFLGGFFNEITLGGVTRTTWPQAGSGSQSMDDVYGNGSVVNVDNTDEIHRLGSGRKFKLVNSDGTVTYMEAEGGKGITFPGNDLRENLLPNSHFAVWSNGTLENVGGNLVTNGSFNSDTSGWSAVGTTTLVSVSGGQSGNCLQVSYVSGSVTATYQMLSGLTVGKLYRLTVYVKSGTSGDESFYIAAQDNAGATNLQILSGTSSSTWSTYSIVWKATEANNRIFLRKNSSAAGTMLFDEINVLEVTPGCINADIRGPDGWSKASGTLVLRQHSDPVYTKEGCFYSLKIMGGDTTYQVSSPCANNVQDLAWVAQLKGRTATFGCWVWCASPSKARISIYDTQHSYSTYHSGSGAWEWLEITRMVPSGTATFYVSLFSGASSTAYFSQPQLVLGSSIGAGNCLPRAGEIIWTESPVALSTLDNRTGLSTTSGTILIPEVDTGGAIGKGAKALYLSVAASDSGSAGADVLVSLGPTSLNQLFSCSSSGLANGRIARAQGWVPLAPDNTLIYVLTAAGAGTLTVSKAKITGVQF